MKPRPFSTLHTYTHQCRCSLRVHTNTNKHTSNTRTRYCSPSVVLQSATLCSRRSASQGSDRSSCRHTEVAGRGAGDTHAWIVSGPAASWGMMPLHGCVPSTAFLVGLCLQAVCAEAKRHAACAVADQHNLSTNLSTSSARPNLCTNLCTSSAQPQHNLELTMIQCPVWYSSAGVLRGTQPHHMPRQLCRTVRV